MIKRKQFLTNRAGISESLTDQKEIMSFINSVGLVAICEYQANDTVVVAVYYLDHSSNE